MKEFFDLRLKLWNDVHDPAPLDKMRAQRLLEFVRKASHDASGNLIFTVGDIKVCEGAFLRLIGLTKSKNISEAPGQWQRLKKDFRTDGTNALSDEKISLDVRESVSWRKDQAMAYINKIADEYSDTFAAVSAEGDDDPDRDVQAEDARQVPHVSIVDFFREYHHYCTHDLGLECCSESTFRAAFNSMYDQGRVRLMGSKDGFVVCPVCINCHNILTGQSARKDTVIKEVAQTLKRLHLKMQRHERQHAENVIMRCREVDSNTGQPKEAYWDIDGMTVMTCNTPKFNKGMASERSHIIQNRNIGCRIVCGPVDKFISINTDNLIPGGGNVLVEATRICIETLADILAKEHNMILPSKGHFQYDNCSENKNKTMHCFFSHLVEAGYFKEIELFFLIVGHTHNRLDQWFSILSKAIKKADKILSVHALHEIFRIAHKTTGKSGKKSTPAYRVIQMQIYHDWDRYYAPVVNESIKYHGIPHRVKFGPLLHSMKCPYTYMHTSPPTEWDCKWLPETPANVDITVNELSLESFMLFNGEDNVCNAMGFSDPQQGRSELLNGSDKSMETLRRLTACIPEIKRLEINALAEMVQRSTEDHERQVIQNSDGYVLNVDIVRDVEEALLKQNDQSKGYIFWIRHGSNSAESLAEITKKCPEVLPNPKMWQDIIDEEKNAAAAAIAVAEADRQAGRALQKVEISKERKEKLVLAKDRLQRFMNGATTMQLTANEILKTSKLVITRSTDEMQSIQDATNGFTKAVLTPEEVRWYQSFDSLIKIIAAQKERVANELRKEWQLLNLPKLSEEQKLLMASIKESYAANQLATMKALAPLLTSKKDFGIAPNTEIVRREGNLNAGPGTSGPIINSTTNNAQPTYNTMTKPQLLEICKTRKIKCSNLNKADLIAKLVESDKAEDLRQRAAQIGIGSSTTPVLVLDSTCTCVECEEVAEIACVTCGDREYCSLHAEHSCHLGQRLPPEVYLFLHTPPEAVSAASVDSPSVALVAPAASVVAPTATLAVPAAPAAPATSAVAPYVASVAPAASEVVPIVKKRKAPTRAEWEEIAEKKRQRLDAERIENIRIQIGGNLRNWTPEQYRKALDFESFSTEFLVSLASSFGLVLDRQRSRKATLERFISVILN
jgi:hypothetical protein